MLHVIDHPLIADELAHLRHPDCRAQEFRQRVRRIASLMVPAVTADLFTHTVECPTPLEITTGRKLVRTVTLVPVLRAGLGFLDGFLDLIPQASVAHIGMARNEETLQPEPYYMKHPPLLEERDMIVLDPMLATGGSSIEAIRALKNVGAASIRAVFLVASPEGVAALESAFPEVSIYTAALDRCLNDRGYILPGLGDAGDRLFGTHG